MPLTRREARITAMALLRPHVEAGLIEEEELQTVVREALAAPQIDSHAALCEAVAAAAADALLSRGVAAETVGRVKADLLRDDDRKNAASEQQKQPDVSAADAPNPTAATAATAPAAAGTASASPAAAPASAPTTGFAAFKERMKRRRDEQQQQRARTQSDQASPSQPLTASGTAPASPPPGTHSPAADGAAVPPERKRPRTETLVFSAAPLPETMLYSNLY